MCKGKLAVLCLVAVSMLLVSGITGTANAGIIDPCVSYWELHVSGPPPCPLFVCPQGDTDSFLDQGWWIWICVIDITGQPIPAIPPTDFWLVDCDPLGDAALCGGSASSGADSMTNAAGMTTMSLGTLTGGGCADGMALVAQNFVVLDSTTNCNTPFCCPIWLRSPDIDGDLIITLIDLSIFASSFPPQPYDKCCDFDINAVVNLQDLSRFAFHFGPPGHSCS
jgi:hypothetical protein